MKIFSKFAIAAIALSSLVGCAQNDLGGNTYSRSDARRVMEVQYATVQSVRSIRMEGNSSMAGSAIGAIGGGLLGSALGKGFGKQIATVGGAVGGAVLGSNMEKNMSETNGLEIIVRLDNGRSFAVIQARDEMQFAPGDRVNLVGSGNNLRVTR